MVNQEMMEMGLPRGTVEKEEGIPTMKPLSKKAKCLIVVAVMLVCCTGMLFAASDDFGINEYLGKIKSLIMAIGGGLMIISLCIWAVQGLITKTVTPDGWKKLATLFGCGVLLLVGPMIISSVFGTLGGVSI